MSYVADNGQTILATGDTNRAGTMEVIETRWQRDETLSVTIACPFPRTKRSDEAARRLARRCLMYPELTRSSRITHVAQTLDSLFRVHVTFVVSRNEC